MRVLETISRHGARTVVFSDRRKRRVSSHTSQVPAQLLRGPLSCIQSITEWRPSSRGMAKSPQRQNALRTARLALTLRPGYDDSLVGDWHVPTSSVTRWANAGGRCASNAGTVKRMLDPKVPSTGGSRLTTTTGSAGLVTITIGRRRIDGDTLSISLTARITADTTAYRDQIPTADPRTAHPSFQRRSWSARHSCAYGKRGKLLTKTGYNPVDKSDLLRWIKCFGT
jgi:hypothetical protein